MGYFRTKSKSTMVKKNSSKSLSASRSRVAKAYGFARSAVGLVAKMTNLPQHLGSICRLKSRDFVTNSLPNSRFSLGALRPLTLGRFRFKKITSSIPPTPPPIPQIIVTSPNGNVVSYDEMPLWKKAEVTNEVRWKYHTWGNGEFLSPIYPVDAAKDWKRTKKAERFFKAEEKRKKEKQERKRRRAIRKALLRKHKP